MTSSAGPGLFQKSVGGVWQVRRGVPKDLVPHLGFEKKASLKTKDLELARLRRDAQWLQWDEEFARARRSTITLPTPDHLLQAIETWRRARCGEALSLIKDDLQASAAASVLVPPVKLQPHSPDILRAAVKALIAPAEEMERIRKTPVPNLSKAGAVAERYFSQHPGVSRDVTTPTSTAILLGRLQMACRDPEAWRYVDGFDQALTDAAAYGGLSEPLTASLLQRGRPAFAHAWLDVVQHEEAERKQAALFLAANAATHPDPRSIKVQSAPNAFTPREDDHTVHELIEAYKADRIDRLGVESTIRKYKHIFSALEEVLGPTKPVRAVTRGDARAVKSLLRKLPAHLGKRYPGLTLEEAVAATESEDDLQRLAPVTVNNYLSNMVAIFNWAIKEDWLDRNPATDLIDPDEPLVERRGFNRDELEKVFGGLQRERQSNSWRFWAPAIGLYTGARLNEICQLDVGDLADYEGVAYLRLTVFDPKGRRRPGQKLKTKPSKRNVPLHPELIQAGLLDFIRARGSGRLFPELPKGPDGGYAHDASKWFGRYLSQIGLDDPGLMFHGFRHGFRDACDAGDVGADYRKALGGWAAASEAEKYGNRQFVPVLHRELCKINLGGFSLNATSTMSPEAANI